MKQKCLVLVLLSLMVGIPARAAGEKQKPLKPGSPFDKATVEGPLPGVVIGRDDRVPMTSKKYPWSVIGKILFEDGGHCTGTLVGEDIILTNAHCVLDKRGEMRSGSKFLPGFMYGRQHFESRIVWAHYGNPKSGTDYAIARLASPLGKKLGYIGSYEATTDELTGLDWENKLVLAGYSGDYANGQTAGAHVGCGVVADAGDAGFAHECDTFGGSSGSALFAWFGGGPMAVGLNWGHNPKQVINYGVPGEVFDPKIIKYRANDEGKSSYTYVHLCNESGHATLSTAMAYHNGSSWQSEGWWLIPRGECKEVPIDKKYQGNAYFHARANGSTWGGGDYSFCVQSQPFTFTSADTRCPSGSRARFSTGRKMDYGDMNVMTFN